MVGRGDHGRPTTYVLTGHRQMEVTPIPSEGLQEKQDELMNLMTIMYMAAQETTNDRAGMASVRESLRE